MGNNTEVLPFWEDVVLRQNHILLYLFNVVFLRVSRFPHYTHLQTANINNYKNKETRPIIDDNDQYENPGNPNVVFPGLGVSQPHTFTNNNHQQKTKTNKSNKYFSN